MNNEKNVENNNQIDELVDRAMEDVNNNSVDEESNVDVQLDDNVQAADNNFNGVFRSADSSVRAHAPKLAIITIF